MQTKKTVLEQVQDVFEIYGEFDKPSQYIEYVSKGGQLDQYKTVELVKLILDILAQDADDETE